MPPQPLYYHIYHYYSGRPSSQDTARLGTTVLIDLVSSTWYSGTHTDTRIITTPPFLPNMEILILQHMTILIIPISHVVSLDFVYIHKMRDRFSEFCVCLWLCVCECVCVCVCVSGCTVDIAHGVRISIEQRENPG